MTNNIKIANIKEGVSIGINGDVKVKDIEAMTQDCGNGGCDCSPELLPQIDSIEVSGNDGDVHVVLKGKELNAKEVQSCMSGCDCGL